MPQLPVYWPFIEFDLTYKCPTGLLSDSRNQYIGHTQLLIFLKVNSKRARVYLQMKDTLRSTASFEFASFREI